MVWFNFVRKSLSLLLISPDWNRDFNNYASKRLLMCIILKSAQSSSIWGKDVAHAQKDASRTATELIQLMDRESSWIDWGSLKGQKGSMFKISSTNCSTKGRETFVETCMCSSFVKGWIKRENIVIRTHAPLQGWISAKCITYFHIMLHRIFF